MIETRVKGRLSYTVAYDEHQFETRPFRIVKLFGTRSKSIMREIKPKPSACVLSNHSQRKISQTCVSCQERHLKCSGGPVCTRCAVEGSACQFKTSRRGQRDLYHQLPNRHTSGPLTSVACVSCRERHLKCSGKPACTRCSKESTTCLFTPSRRGRPSTQVSLNDAISDASNVAEPLPRSLTFGGSTDPKSSRSYQYFCESTSQDLCGHNDQAFWTNLVMRIGHDQPAIRHILTALGSLGESLEIAYSTWRDELAQPLHVFSLKQYSKAISLLKSGNTCLSTEIVLISCVLLVCFETLQKSYESAMGLLVSGLKLLAQWQGSESGRTNPLKQEVVQAFSRASMQAKTFTKVAAARTTTTSPRLISSTRTLVPTINITSTFSDLHQASACLETLVEHGYSIMDPVRLAPDYRLCSKLLARFPPLLQTWYATLDQFLCQHQDTGPHFRKQVLYLKIQYFVAHIMTPSPYNNAESRFDTRTREFELIVGFATEFLGLVTDWDNIIPFPDTEASHKCGLGIIPALYICASRCRCPVLRRKAVDLLCLRNWRERLFSSAVPATIAEWIIATEEQGLVDPQTCEDVPETNRIRILECARIEEKTLPNGVESTFNRGIEIIWYRPRARFDLCFAKEPTRLLIHYVKSPWDLTGRIEKVLLEFL